MKGRKILFGIVWIGLIGSLFFNFIITHNNNDQNKYIEELNKQLSEQKIKTETYSTLFHDEVNSHNETKKECKDYRDNAEKIIALNPLKEFYSDNLISEMVKDIPTGYIFRSGFVPTAFFGDSIGMHGFYRTDHKGIDGYGKGGDTYITPVAEGKVTKTGEDLIYGKYVYVQHSRFVRTFYAHGKTIFNRARVGQIVGSDDVIMEMGDTGMADGKHVHAEVQVCVDEVNDIWIAVDFFPFFTKGINE